MKSRHYEEAEVTRGVFQAWKGWQFIRVRERMKTCHGVDSGSGAAWGLPKAIPAQATCDPRRSSLASWRGTGPEARRRICEAVFAVLLRFPRLVQPTYDWGRQQKLLVEETAVSRTGWSWPCRPRKGWGTLGSFLCVLPYCSYQRPALPSQAGVVAEEEKTKVWGTLHIFTTVGKKTCCLLVPSAFLK